MSAKKRYPNKSQRAVARKTDAHKRAGSRQKARPAFADLEAEVTQVALAELPRFEALHPTDDQRESYRVAKEEAIAQDQSLFPFELYLACVVRLDRSFPVLCYEGGFVRAEFSARLTKAQGIQGSANKQDITAATDERRLAVGDYVLARIPDSHDRGIVLAIIPRKSAIARWRGSNRGERQLLATNVDSVLIVQALSDTAPNLDRIIRSAVIAADSDCSFGVIFTKADRSTKEVLLSLKSSLTNIFDSDVPIVITSDKTLDSQGMSELLSFCEEHSIAYGDSAVLDLIPPDSIAMLLGESGAGKSTLINRLLGYSALETGAVRTSDDQGRHTTVARRMVALPNAGIIIDEPGLRSLQLVGHERGLAKVFPEIRESALFCKFRDCTHSHEPGCAVRAMADEGEVNPERVCAYIRLAQEMRQASKTLDPDIIL